jgi:DNA-binding MarR family transcriptional regulator
MKQGSNRRYFGYLLERTSRKVKLSFSQAFSQLGLDITPEQWVILENLYFQNGLSQTELAEKIFKNTPTISRILDLLGKKGLTERTRFENDRRRHRVFLTPTGKAVVEKAQPIAQELRDQGWQNLSEEDYNHLERILNQVFNNFE